MQAQARLRAALACAVLLAALCLPGLCACKDSRAIKNIKHDQNAEQVDHESGDNLRVAAEDGRVVDEDTGLYVVGVANDPALPVNVVYVSSEPETTLPVARFEYDAESGNSTEASEPVSESPSEEPQEQDEPDEADEPSETDPQEDSGDDRGEAPQGGDASDGESGDGDAGGSDADTAGDEPDDWQAKYDTTGEKPDIPDVESIAAYGEMAVIVQMLGGSDASGGSTPLAVADDALVAGRFADVFADEGAGSVSGKGWNYSSSKGTYKADAGAIAKAKPDTVLVYNEGELSASQRKKLKAKKVSLTVVPELTSDTGVVRAVEIVAKMLDKATDGVSVQRYESYKSAHDGLVSDIMDANGGYGAYQGATVYDASIKDSSLKRYPSSMCTLVIGDWDYGATYAYKNVVSDAGAGVGIATVGYRTSPVSYYLGVAGVVNTAAAIDTSKSSAGKLAPAWQFNPTELNPRDISPTVSGFSGKLYKDWGTGVTKTTLAVPNGKAFSPDSHGFGHENFPVVIVADEKMKESMGESARASKGLYHDFGGLISEGTLYTAIETDLSDQAQLDKRVRVNPHGLFSSWLDGSAEAFLECAWASSDVPQFQSQWTGSAHDEVKRFYKEQYRYPEISDGDVDAILAGTAG